MDAAGIQGDRQRQALFWVSMRQLKIWRFSYNENEGKNDYLE